MPRSTERREILSETVQRGLPREEGTTAAGAEVETKALRCNDDSAAALLRQSASIFIETSMAQTVNLLKDLCARSHEEHGFDWDTVRGGGTRLSSNCQARGAQK